MSNRKYIVQDAGRGWISKFGTGLVATGSVAAAVVAVTPQGAALESLVYNPQAMQSGNLASGANGGALSEVEAQPASESVVSGEPPTLEDYLVLGDIPASLSNQQVDVATSPVLGSILTPAQSGGSVGNVTNSTQYAGSSTGSSGSAGGNQGNVTNPTQTAGSGNSGGGNSNQNGNVTSPTPGGGEDSHGEDSYGEDSHGEDSYGEDSHSEDSHDED